MKNTINKEQRETIRAGLLFVAVLCLLILVSQIARLGG